MGDVVVAPFVLNKNQYYVQTLWEEKSFNIVITDGGEVWNATATEKLIERSLKPAGMDLKEYMSLAREALTSQDFSRKKFSYTVSPGKSTKDIEFSWKIKLGEDDTSLPSLSVDLLSPISTFAVKNSLNLVPSKNPIKAKQSFFDWLIERASVLESEARDLTQRNKNLQQERDTTLSRFDRMAQEKLTLENDLYKKFVVVLNEKKMKIRELKEESRNS